MPWNWVIAPEYEDHPCFITIPGLNEMTQLQTTEVPALRTGPAHGFAFFWRLASRLVFPDRAGCTPSLLNPLMQHGLKW